ncbi:MAG: hypothetical protein ACJ768_18910 [Gaiellaceae bacterium]
MNNPPPVVPRHAAIDSSFWVVLGGGLATGVCSLGFLALCLFEGGDWLAFAVPLVGIVLFLGFTMLGHYTEPDQAEAAIKHGIAAGFVGAYFTVLGLSHLSTGGAALFDPSLVKYLTVAVGAIVSFYFGATAAVQIAKK